MYIFLDISIILIFCLTVYTVTKRGFVKTVFDFGSLIAAIIVSKIFSPALSDYFYNGLYGKISNTLRSVLDSLADKGELPENLELESLARLFKKYNIELHSSMDSEAADGVVQYLTQNIVELLAYALAFVLIFVLSLIALKLISFVLDSFFKLPILKSINKGLGFVLGIVLAAIYVFLFVALMQLAVPYLGAVYPEIFSQNAIDNTIVFKYLYNFEWVQFFVN